MEKLTPEGSLTSDLISLGLVGLMLASVAHMGGTCTPQNTDTHTHTHTHHTQWLLVSYTRSCSVFLPCFAWIHLFAGMHSTDSSGWWVRFTPLVETSSLCLHVFLTKPRPSGGQALCSVHLRMLRQPPACPPSLRNISWLSKEDSEWPALHGVPFIGNFYRTSLHGHKTLDKVFTSLGVNIFQEKAEYWLSMAENVFSPQLSLFIIYSSLWEL